MATARSNTIRDIQYIKEANPCTDCKNYFPYYVMQFDHVRGRKVMKVNRLVYVTGRKNVDAEIDKCELVCANCHAIRSYKRQHGILN